MTDDPSQRRKTASGKTRSQPPSRKLSFPSRVRKSFRRGVDRLLATDLVWSGLFVFVVVFLLAGQRCAPDVPPFVAGQPAPEDIRAPFDITFVDEQLTEERRRQAREEVLEVWAHNHERGSNVAAQLASLFEEGRATLDQAPPSAPAVAGALTAPMPPGALEVLEQRRFDVELERELTSLLTRLLSQRVVVSKTLLERKAGVVLIKRPGGAREQVSDFSTFVDLNQVREELRRELIQRLDLPAKEERALGDLLESFVDATVHLEQETTDRERQRAAHDVRPMLTRITQGETLVRQGATVTAATIDMIESATRAAHPPLSTREFLGFLFVASLLAFFLYRYTRYHQRAFRKLEHLHALLMIMLVSMLVLSSGMLWLARRIVDNLNDPFNQIGTYTYLIPLGAGAILVALLANGRIATVYAAFASVLFGAINDWDSYLMAWALLVQCAGVYAISTYRERAALLRAGLVVGGAGATTVLALETIQGTVEPLSRSFYGAGLAFLGGAVGVGLLISFSLPLLERLFNVLTDIRLLELSNVNNPLLSELAFKAPGSYNHSLVVGTLAEEAARAIGANSLFCRVAAFYHDIGKINKPEYYVENQQRGVNPHDRLSPSMSALIIASHVKDGIKLAREAGLPEQIIDIIPQHHGTKLMTYFYEKAKTSADPSLGPVKEEDFRYPGPKPQTREAAIFMLADAVEAAARTIDEPTANRLKEMIRKVTNAIVLDRELDACDMTFTDLDKIQNAFLRCLVSMYHHRVDYPGFDFGKAKPEGKDESKAEVKPDPKPAAEPGTPKIARSP